MPKVHVRALEPAKYFRKLFHNPHIPLVRLCRSLLFHGRYPPFIFSLLDVAASAEMYARRQQLGEEAIGYAHEIKTYALRKLGEMLKATNRNTGAAGIGPIAVPNRNHNPKLSDFHIDKKVSMLAQQIAALPMEKVEAIAEQPCQACIKARAAIEAKKHAKGG